MRQLITINTETEHSQGELKLNYHQPKRYILSKLIPVNQKGEISTFYDERFRRKSTKPEYFTSILRQQKKNMFINTFLRKLKTTVIPRILPDHQLLRENTDRTEDDYMQIQVSKHLQNILLLVWLIHAFSLLLLNSMALIFQEIDNSDFFFNFMIISLLLHCLEIGSKFLVHINYQENKVTKVHQITNKYIKGDFWLDAIVLFGLLMFFTIGNNASASFIFRVMIFGKVHSLVYIMEHLEITFIQNEYREQIWSLIKVFMFNFIFAHILTLALVLMARIKQNDNWIVNRGLADAEWTERYIWAYYWATTIMLTVGFGDIVPKNSAQALSLIFIETMSCIVLAYNINRVGIIIQKIRSYEATKNSHLKTFNHIKEKSEFSDETKTRIMNYIKESTEIKRNFNLGEEKQFIQSLPQSFKSDMLKEMNRHVWNGMIFFQNLSEETLVKLSITIEKKLAHPQEILYTRGNNIEILVFNGGGFGYAYNHGNSSVNNGRIMQHFQVPSNKYQIATLDFLFKNKLDYDIKCTDYSVVYQLSTDQLIKILNHNSFDSEYFFMIKDKDKYLANEFQLTECQLCKKQRHSVFRCAKMHYLPLRQHVVHKYKDKYYPKIFKYLALRIKTKKFQTLVNFKENKAHIKSTRRFFSNQESNLKSEMRMLTQQFDSQKSFTENISVSKKDITKDIDLTKFELTRQSTPFTLSKVDTGKLYKDAIDELRSKIDNMMHPTMFSWDLEVDLAFNYKFYFRKYNSDEIFTTHTKKVKTKPPVTQMKESFGYRRRNKGWKIGQQILEMFVEKKEK